MCRGLRLNSHFADICIDEPRVNQSYFTGVMMSNEDVWKSVQNLYREDQLFVFDPVHPLFPGVRYTFAPTYERIKFALIANAKRNIEGALLLNSAPFIIASWSHER